MYIKFVLIYFCFVSFILPNTPPRKSSNFQKEIHFICNGLLYGDTIIIKDKYRNELGRFFDKREMLITSIDSIIFFSRGGLEFPFLLEKTDTTLYVSGWCNEFYTKFDYSAKDFTAHVKAFSMIDGTIKKKIFDTDYDKMEHSTGISKFLSLEPNIDNILIQNNGEELIRIKISPFPMYHLDIEFEVDHEYGNYFEVQYSNAPIPRE